MKKLLALVIAVAIAVVMFVVPAAAEDDYERVLSYTGGASVGLWLKDDNVNGTEKAVIFNAASAFRRLGIPQYWASNGSNGALVTFKAEVFNYVTDYATSVAGTPLFTETVNPTGDVEKGILFDMGKDLPKGEYVFRFTIVGGDDSYLVLPAVATAYSNVRLNYTGGVFGFYVDFVEKGLANYFNRISTMADADEVMETVLCPKGGNPVDVKVSGDMGIKLTIPEGYKLRTFIGLNSPTWGNASGEGSDVKVEVFAWNEDYATSIGGTVLASCEVTGHPDNNNLVCELDKDVPAGTYLAVFSATGEKSIGFWCGTDLGAADAIFVNGASNPNCPGMNYRLVVLPEEGNAGTGEGENENGEIVDFDSEKSFQIGQSLDAILWNGGAINTPGDGKARANLDSYLEADGTLDVAKYNGETIGFQGWVVFRKAIAQFGYMIGNTVVFDDSFTVQPEPGLAAAVGGIFPNEDCSGVLRFLITVPLANTEGKTVVAVAKLADGTIVKLNSASIHDRDTTVRMTGPENAKTGDATVATFAVIAVLAMGAAVVFMKKKAF